MIAFDQRMLAAVAMGLLFAVASEAPAAEFEYGVSLGIGTTDNVSRTELDPIDENLATAGLAFSFVEDTRILTADISSDLSYLEYLDETYESDLVGSLNGEAMFQVVPDRFEWEFTDNFGQVLIDSSEVGTPENREDLNYFMTGPDFTLAFGAATQLVLGGRYSLVDYETSQLDSQRLLGNLSLVRGLSTSSSVSINGSFERAEFDDTLLSDDYDRQEAYLRYEAKSARADVAFDIGQTVLKDSRAESNDGFLLRATLLRRMSRSMSLSAAVSQEFADSSDVFRRTQSNGGNAPGLQAIRSSSVPFENRGFSLAWEIDGARTGMGLAVTRTEERFEDASEADRTLTSAEARFRRELTPALSFRLFGTYLDARYETPGIDYDEMRGEASLDWQVGRITSVSLQYQRFDRTGGGFQQPFEENAFWLLLGFGSAPSGSTSLLSR